MATREETKKMIEVMQAFVDGKEIEELCEYGKWISTDGKPKWDWQRVNYRVKVHEPKFKVGDYVRILNGREIKDYRHGWAAGMNQYVGFIFRVSAVQEDNGIFCYTPDVKPYYSYDERGLELVEINNQ